MTKNFRFLYVGIAALLIVLSISVPARADMIVTLAAAPGTDLSNIHVGDTLVFNSIGSSADVGERLIVNPPIHIFSTDGPIDFVKGVYAPTVGDLLTTSPILAVWTFHAVATGEVEIFNGFPEPGPSGDVTTNLGSIPIHTVFIRCRGYKAPYWCVPERPSKRAFPRGHKET